MKTLAFSLGLASALVAGPAWAEEPVKTSTVVKPLVGLDLELARYLALLENFEEISDLELFELLPFLEDEDDR